MLNLYTNVTPNLSGTHYYFKDFSKYKLLLASNLFKEIDNTRYDINKGFIRVKLGTDLTEANYKNITYICNTSDNMFYHVTSQIVQSGYAYYGVNVDLWASYLPNATFKNINVRKCNRRLSDNGELDTIRKSKDLEVAYLGDKITYNLDELYVVFIGSQSSGTPNQTTHAFANKVTDFIEAYNHLISGETPTETSIFSRIKACLRGIHLIRGNNNYQYFTDGTISKVMILPQNYIRKSDQVLTIAYRGVSYTQRTCVFALPSIMYEIFYLDTNYNKKYVVGVTGEGIAINNKITPTKITYTFAINSSNIFIFVNANGEQYDISSSFTLKIRNNDEEGVDNITPHILGAVGGAIKTVLGILAENPLLIARGGTSLLQGQLSSVSNNGRAVNSLSVNGELRDAEVSYTGINNEDITNILYTPFKINITTSLYDEEKNARKTGANFNEYIDAIESIFNKDLLGTGSTTDDTYIVASMDIDAIPTTAVDLIEGRFASGVYLHYIDYSN